MSPNCEHCDDGDHYLCDKGWCACRGRGGLAHPPVNQQTEQGIPVYAVLDLWMALGHDYQTKEFDEAITTRGIADVWAHLLQEVRDLNNRGIPEGKTMEAQAVASLPDPPFLVQARKHLESFAQIDTVTVDLTKGEAVQDARGRDVHYSQDMALTITGRLT